MDNRPIGIFDSGVGGLTVAKEIHRLLPNESTIYFGDTARAPYGGKTANELLQFSHEIVNFLLQKNVKAVVIACGTSSSVTYEKLLDEFPALPIVDVIRPGVQACLQQPNDRFGLIATAATIKSGVFAKLLMDGFSTGCKSQPVENVTLHARACPLFAPMVEAGLQPSHPAMQFAIEAYVGDLRNKIDALVLGCTHYPLLTDALASVLGNIEFINLGVAAAQATKERLMNAGLLADRSNKPTHEYYVSGNADVFCKTGKIVLGEEIVAVKFT